MLLGQRLPGPALQPDALTHGLCADLVEALEVALQSPEVIAYQQGRPGTRVRMLGLVAATLVGHTQAELREPAGSPGGARSAVHQAACSRHRPETGAFAARRALLGCSGRGPHGAAPAPRFQSRSRLNYLAEAGALYALAAAIAGKPLLPP